MCVPIVTVIYVNVKKTPKIVEIGISISISKYSCFITCVKYDSGVLRRTA